MQEVFRSGYIQTFFLPDRIIEYFRRTLLNPSLASDEIDYFISEGVAINLVFRWFCEMNYKLAPVILADYPFNFRQVH